MTDKNDKLELHMGEDYAVAMLPRDTTDNAAIMFGCNTEDAFCEEVVKRYNAFGSLPGLSAEQVELARKMMLDFDDAMACQKGSDSSASLIVMANYGDLASQYLRAILKATA